MRACVFNKLAMCAVAALVAFGLRADSARTAAKDGAGVKHYGYWLHGKNMKDVDLGLLSLNECKRFDTSGKGREKAAKAAKTGALSNIPGREAVQPV